MINIDYIMNLLDWNNSIEDQSLGIKLAQDVRCINAFLQPGIPYGKRVWGNCAAVLANRSDTELRPYLHQLFEWLIDMNWPGAYCILERLRQYKDKKSFNCMMNICINEAQALNEEVWLNNLSELKTV